MILDNIEPRRVMYFFEEISKIPRKSGNEERIVEYLTRFAKERNYYYVTDEYNNILIKKPASKGYENKDSFALQAHTDMICEKTENSEHDFSKDGLMLYVDDDYIRAKDTTLGADNGIGVAIILAILDDKSLNTPLIEAIFTSEEETTMKGAINFDMNLINSKRIISLDNGKDGMILISSAICNEWRIALNLSLKENISIDKYYQITYKNFLGGHTGGNIGDSSRGNPIKLMSEVLKNIPNIQIIDINGGSRVNVIPRDLSISFIINENNTKYIRKIEEEIEKQKEIYLIYNNELKIILDEKVDMQYTQSENAILKEESEKCLKAYSIQDSSKIINFIYNYTNGVIQKDENDNIILSSCISVINSDNTDVYVDFSTRCNIKEINKKYLIEMNKLIEEYNAQIILHQELMGVEAKENNNLVNLCEKTYKELYNQEMKKVISQGVVEGGFFVSKKPSCEYVCIGPNTYDVHSPNERVSISSLQRFYKYLLEVLKD